MASRVAAWLGAWVALSLLSGCGKAESGAEPIPKSELPTRIGNLLCDSLAGCCQSSGLAMDTASCKTYYATELQQDFNEDTPQAVRYDAQAAGDCLHAIASKIQCGQVKDDEPAACDRVFFGSVALGQPCGGTRECARVAGRSVYCESQDGLSPALCTARGVVPHGKAGEVCSTTCNDSENCGIASNPAPQPGVGDAPAPQPTPVACYRDEGLFCDAGQCAPLRAAGAPCNYYDACRAPAFCNINVGLCMAPQPNGSACQSNSECQSENCDDSSESTADPSGVILRVCVPFGAVTAEQCSRDFSNTSPDATAPAPDPGMNAGAP